MHNIDLSRSLKSDRLSLGVTALNGLMGEKLQKSNNPLAVNMGFFHRNRPLALTRAQFEATEQPVTDKLVVFLHGLASNEQMWAFPSSEDQQTRDSYGSLLMHELGFTPLYVRYNSGLRISYNGQLLAALLEELLQVYPEPVKELVLIGHSLGGLLIRSACHYGRQSGLDWTAIMSKAFYIGTPHHGVPWEALTAGFFRRMAVSESSLAQSISALHESRSPALRDIVNISLIDEHWQEDKTQTPIPWFEGAEHYFIAGSINRNPNHVVSHAFGDVLVPIGSAQSRSALHGHLPVPPNLDQNSVIVPGVKHIALAQHPRVYRHLADWLSGPKNNMEVMGSE
ncbi:MAG: triacylglycerol lipase [Gammaproteobacteria bacterium]|jgi:triacylglycerol lipase